MGWDSKVVWFEGMYLLPQHFQQQERYLEAQLEGRCQPLRPYAWGFSRLEIDEGALALGQISITAAAGILPDGTPFNIPATDDPPQPLEIGALVRDTLVYLSLPMRQSDKPDTECAEDGAGAALSRFRSFERDTLDANIDNDDLTPIRVGRRRLRLVLGSEGRAGLAAVGLARVREVQSIGEARRRVELDTGYIPPALDSRVSTELSGFMKTILGRVQQAADEKVEWVRGRGQVGSGDVSDFMYLQMLNAYDTRLDHLLKRDLVHPEDYYRLALQLASDLAIFTSSSKRPSLRSSYDHDNLQLSFAPVMDELRRALAWVKKRAALQIPLERTDAGVFVGEHPDGSLFKEADFVLAVNLKSLPERAQATFRQDLKIGSTARIDKLVNDRIPGVQIEDLQNVPADIPANREYTYFGLRQNGEEWKQVADSGSFAFYFLDFLGEARDMKLLLYAVRSEGHD